MACYPCIDLIKLLHLYMLHSDNTVKNGINILPQMLLLWHYGMRTAKPLNNQTVPC